MPKTWLERELDKLQYAYQSGNLGALQDAVYWCRHYQQPLPKWANLAISETIKALALGDKKNVGKWSAWLRQYMDDRADYEIFSLVGEARDKTVPWADIYSVINSILLNKVDDEFPLENPETYNRVVNRLKKVYKRTLDRLKENPSRYYLLKTFQERNQCHPYNPVLWKSIKKITDSGKFRKQKTIKKQ